MSPERLPRRWQRLGGTFTAAAPDKTAPTRGAAWPEGRPRDVRARTSRRARPACCWTASPRCCDTRHRAREDPAGRGRTAAPARSRTKRMGSSGSGGSPRTSASRADEELDAFLRLVHTGAARARLRACVRGPAAAAGAPRGGAAARRAAAQLHRVPGAARPARLRGQPDGAAQRRSRCTRPACTCRSGSVSWTGPRPGCATTWPPSYSSCSRPTTGGSFWSSATSGAARRSRCTRWPGGSRYELPHLVPILIELRALDKAHTVDGLVAAHLANHGEDCHRPQGVPLHASAGPHRAAVRRLRRAGHPGQLRPGRRPPGDAAAGRRRTRRRSWWPAAPSTSSPTPRC